ncbi:MAG: helix-turn-helix transcriptional regulator, partial [Propionicimonas sp.]|nr:helix-turn-helix transcriptional regulator [Propionicimonas sp.]
ENLPDAVTALWNGDDAVRVDLNALAAEETAALLEAQLGGPAEAVATEWAVSMSAGNPLYLRELVAGAVAVAALFQDHPGGLWRLGRRPTPSVALAELITTRLDGIGAAGQTGLALLRIGEPLPASTVAQLCGDQTIGLLTSHDLAVVETTAGERMVRLAHPLYGEIARLHTADHRLAELRTHLAAAVRDRGLQAGDALRVASWLRDAGAGIDTQLLLDAAIEAYEARDPALAAEFAERAEAGSGAWQATLLRGRALAALGDHAGAEATLAGLEGRLPAAADAAEYLFARISNLVWGLHLGPAARALVERAADWWLDPAWQQHAAGLRLMVTSAIGELAEATAVADSLTARQELSPPAAALVATSGVIAWLHSGRTAAAITAAERALPPPPRDEKPGDRELAGLISWSLARIESGHDWEAAEERIARVLRVALTRGDRVTAGPAAGLLGHLALVSGRPVTADRLLRDAVGHLELHDPRGLSVVIVAQLAKAAALRGDAVHADEAREQAWELLAGRPPAWHEAPVLAGTEAWTLAAHGSTTAAWELLLDHAAGLAALPVLQTHLLQDALSLGAPPGRIADLLGAIAGHCDAPIVAATARHAVALRASDGPALLDVARELQVMGARLAAAEAATEAAAAHARAHNTTGTRRASALAQRLLAGCEGASTPALRASRPGSADLTAREREVAELAATGHSNVQIAQLTTVSVRTVESHLYHAMVKLGISSRSELAAVLRADASPELPAAAPAADQTG